MLNRRLEPEVMDAPDEALDYNAMDHSRVNRLFVEDFLKTCGTCLGRRVLDVGTGTALIPIELCRQDVLAQVVAIDLAEEMLKLGRQNIAAFELSGRIQLELIDAKALPFANETFDAVISNSIVHHIPEPIRVLTEMVRVLRPGGWLFVRDLLRPDSEPVVEHLVATYAGTENLHSQQMFRQSLQAALSLEELRKLIEPLKIPADAVQQTTDRHWTIAWQSSE